MVITLSLAGAIGLGLVAGWSVGQFAALRTWRSGLAATCLVFSATALATSFLGAPSGVVTAMACGTSALIHEILRQYLTVGRGKKS